MLQALNGKLKIAGLALGVALIGGLSSGGEAFAASCDENSAESCIGITFGEIVGGTNLMAPNADSITHGIDKTYFYFPVSMTIARSSGYSVKVYSENGGELRSPNGDVIPTLTGEAGKGTSLQDLGEDGSVWGYRANLGETASDLTKNYLKVPGESDPEANIISNEAIIGNFGTIKKVLTLGFAAAVDGNLPAGNYSDRIVVAVTATPLQTTAFGVISTMQEMTSEICATVTTPSKDAELIDATGAHHGDDRYVPEVTLTDTRDGKTYLVRKLADGNCWMSQNLSLDLSTNKTLTSVDTDLNSKASWTPTHTTQTAAGTIWGENDNQDHSISYGWSQYWAGGTTFNATGVATYGGTAGYAQRGNYYNWFAATAGSGKSTDLNTTTDAGTIAGTYRIQDGTVQDSICPKGWMLPIGGETAVNSTGGDVKSFYNLVQIYTGNVGNSSGTINTLYAFPMYFAPTGFYRYKNGVIDDVGTVQFYLSGTAHVGVNSARVLTFAPDLVYPGTNDGRKGAGYSVRCVAR